MIMLARVLKECGSECAPRQIWEAAGVSPSTYWRAEGSLGRSPREVLSAHPELQGLDFSRQVAEMIRKDLAPQLTRLLAGDVEINTYHRSQGRSARTERRMESKAGTSRPGGVHGGNRATGSVRSTKPDGKTPGAVKETVRKKPAKPAKHDSTPSLFDLLPS